MGQAVKIVELAERMIRLSGLEPGQDIDIVFTGMRPGERLNEILFAHLEPLAEIGIAGIMAARPNELPIALIRKWIKALQEAVAGNDIATVKTVLAAVVPESASSTNGSTATAARQQ
jgi:FlaA1/EpsC-like NDP-sugar epimerase